MEAAKLAADVTLIGPTEYQVLCGVLEEPQVIFSVLTLFNPTEHLTPTFLQRQDRGCGQECSE